MGSRLLVDVLPDGLGRMQAPSSEPDVKSGVFRFPVLPYPGLSARPGADYLPVRFDEWRESAAPTQSRGPPSCATVGHFLAPSSVRLAGFP